MPAYVVEYELEEMNLAHSELQALADLVRGSPIYVRIIDKKICATIRTVSVKETSLLFTLKFLDPYLEKNIDNVRSVGKLYTILDPVACLLEEPN